MTPLVSCAFCGRDNEPQSRYCIDCGKPMTASAARPVPAYESGAVLTGARQAADHGAGAADASVDVIRADAPSPFVPDMAPCPRCAMEGDASLPFCAHCGARMDATLAPHSCWTCGNSYTEGADLFCSHCGTRVGQRVSVELNNSFDTLEKGMRTVDAGPRLSLLDDNGDVAKIFTLDHGEAVLGRGDADIRFEDVFLSPLHARLELRDGDLWLRDLGSRNGTWVFIEGPTKLMDNDQMLVGSQLLRFRRLGYPGPHPPEADSTRRMGSMIPAADVAVLEQLRADGSVRDTFHLSPARTVMLGRESGDWVFPYDQTMSGKHCEVRSQDAEFFVHDAGSRNGVAVAVRGDRQVTPGQRILVGDQVLRVESLGL